MQPRPLHPEFQALLDRQPYDLVLNGLRLTVDRDVFPPDPGRCAQNMAKLARHHAAWSALDMGCGSGYLALSLKRGGVPHVWAADIHPRTVECARKNLAQNPELGPVTVVQSDLFEAVPESQKFDLIVFNQPFGPGPEERVCGCGPDGGSAICHRFRQSAPAYLAENGVTMMAISDRAAPRHDPRRAAAELGLIVKVLLHQFYNQTNNFIYAIRPVRK